MAAMGLPAAFGDVPLGEWSAVTPEDARLRGLVADPARMLVYSRQGVSGYDAIAERIAAVTPRDPSGGLTGRLAMRASNERARRVRRPPELEAVRVEQDHLGHRPIDLVPPEGRIDYTTTTDHIVFRLEGSPVEWRYALTYPPSMMAEASADDDPAEPFAWQVAEPMQGLWWLPFGAVLRRGGFARWQELGGERVQEVGRGGLPLFLSHRWLATDRPDPEGRQARLVAWQLVAAVCEAVQVAAARGLHAPRRRSTLLATRVGIGGSDLAEAIVVALLRPSLDDEGLATAAAEARAIEHLLDADLVMRADSDAGLGGLRGLLERAPVLAAIAGRIHLWVDWSCLPQPPRDPAEQEEFVAGLRLLNAAQLLGRTVILLDEVEEYTRRAWCLLEALTADRLAGAFDVLSGLPENEDPTGSPYRHLSDLLLDLPHLVWRAMLDAEVLGALDWQEALRRLEVAVTDPADLPYIYERLRAIPAPNGLHTVSGDLVTGVVALPETGPGHVAAPDDLSRPAEPPPATTLGRLEWEGMLTLSERGPVGEAPVAGEAARLPMVRWRPADDGRPQAHVVVVASCEGEAVLMAEWVDAHVGELEAALGVDVTSRSWVADDIAPVGTLVFGGLAREAVAAPNWIVVTSSARREHSSVTAMQAGVARAGGRALAWVIADDGRVETEGAFPIPVPADVAPGEPAPVPLEPSGALLGGVYRGDLVAFLRGGDA